MKHALATFALLFALATPLLAEDGAAQPLNFHKCPQLDLEPVGLPSVKAWYQALPPGRADDQAPWRQLVWFKKDSRTTQKSYFASVDFVNGTVRELAETLPVMQAWTHLWLNGKFYLGSNLPARLSVYDPLTDKLTDLGPCFSDKSLTLYRMAVSPDGVLALGGGTGSDVSLYDPKTGEFTHFGQVAAKPGGGTYAYYLSMDEKFVYVAVRSSDPPELVRLDRATKERTVLLTGSSAQDFLAVNGNVAELTTTDAGAKIKKWYTLADGAATERPGNERPVPWTLPGPGFSGKAPELAIDQAPIIAGEDALILHIQSSDGKEWRIAKLQIVPDTADLLHVAAMADGRLCGLPKAYFAMVLVEPKTGATQRFPMLVSAYGMLPVGRKVFISGYPNSRTLAFDTDKPLTWTEAVPGRPAVDQDDPAANPRLVRAFGRDTDGAHIAMHLCLGSDGNVYAIARRHRYFYGFSLLWFASEAGADGQHAFMVFDDAGAFNHLQISGMQAVDGGRLLLIATSVQYNKQIPGTAPETAALFLFDVEKKQILRKFEVGPRVKDITVATMAGQAIVGAAAIGNEKGVMLFRLNAETGAVEKTRRVSHGLGENLAFQADGSILGTMVLGNLSVLFRINPEDLAVDGLGQFPQGPGSICVLNGEIYLSGAPQIRRVKGLTIVATGAKADPASQAPAAPALPAGSEQQAAPQIQAPERTEP